MNEILDGLWRPSGVLQQQWLEVGRSPAHCLISRVSSSSSLNRRVPKERACHCLLSAVWVNNKQ